jgi:hypothetical protein
MAKGRLEFTNKKRWSKAVQTRADRMKLSAYVELEKLAQRIKAIAEFETPVDTGEMAASWYVEMEMTARGPQAKIGNAAGHAWVVEFGSAPHIIRAKNAAVLANPETGQVFGSEVNHPGTPAFSPLRQALMELGYTLDGVRIDA